jgi:hypothetical protein
MLSRSQNSPSKRVGFTKVNLPFNGFIDFP